MFLMAVDVLCSATSSPPVISPRISFSHDLKEVAESIVAVESDLHHQSLLTIDFDFGVDQSFSSSHEISSADELFSNGRILPVQIKKTLKSHRTHELDQAVTDHPNRKKPEPAKESPEIKKRLIELLSVNIEDEKQPNAKHFWQFRRSTSVNCDDNYSSGNNNISNNYGLLRPLNFLRRNNSTGSAPNPKPSPLPKSIKKQHSLKEGSINCRENASVNCTNQYYYYNHGNENSRSRASPRKSMSSSNRSSSSYGNNGVVGINISPVLNINPSYIAKGTVSLFGISSLFCRKKSKKKKK